MILQALIMLIFIGFFLDSIIICINEILLDDIFPKSFGLFECVSEAKKY